VISRLVSATRDGGAPASCAWRLPAENTTLLPYAIAGRASLLAVAQRTRGPQRSVGGRAPYQTAPPLCISSFVMKATSVRFRALSFFMIFLICTLTVLSRMLSS